MFIHFLFILLIYFLHYSLNSIPTGEKRNKVEKKYLNIVAGILVLLTAIRGANIGTDTRNYLIMYVHHIPNYSFSDIYVAFAESPLVFYLFKIFSLLHLPPQFLLGFIEFIYISAIVRFINVFSKDKLYSFFCFFIIIGLYGFSVPALKQTCALGLMLHAFVDFYEKKLIRAVIFVVSAYFCHKTSLVFVFAFLLYFLRNQKYYFLLIIVFSLLCFTAGRFLLQTAIDVIESENYSGYLNVDKKSTWTVYLYYLLLLGVALFFKKQYDSEDNEESRIIYGFALISLAFQSLSLINAHMFRLAVYYVSFLIVLLPNSFYYGGRRGRQFKTIIAFFMILFYVYVNRNSIVYSFYWQDYDIPYIYFGG